VTAEERRTRIPLDVTDLTAEWMGGVLGSDVADVAVLDAHSGTTGRVKLALTPGRSVGAGQIPQTLFCKIAPFDAEQRMFLRQIGIGAMEARFYEELGRSVPIRVPRVWHAETDEEGGFVIVLEDLDASDCRYPRPSDSDIAERAESTVEELAHLHAAFWEDARFTDGLLAWVPERAGFGAGTSKEMASKGAALLTGMALELFGTHMPPVFERLGRLWIEHTDEILDLWDRGERTLVHGDPHSGNLFTDGQRTGFFDWAMFSRSPGMRDVAYYCANSLPTETRRALQGDLLVRYRSTLASHGIELDEGTAEEQLRLFAVVSWVSASSTAALGSRLQPSARAIAAMERTTAAVDDLDSVGLLHELLG
jgi:hypothetical protein